MDGVALSPINYSIKKPTRIEQALEILDCGGLA